MPPGTTGTLAFCIAARARSLSPIASIASACGPIQVSPASIDAARERRVLGEEAVPGVDRLGAGALRDLDEFVDVEVTERRRSRPDQVGFVGHAHVERVAIGFGVDRNGCNVHLACRADDTDRDLAAVGD